MKAQESRNPFLQSGHGCCPGCAMPIVMRTVFNILGEKTVAVITAGCLGTISGTFPVSPIKLAAYNTPFPSAGAAGSGVRAALDMKGDTETTVIAIAGDGGTFDIGFQALSAAAERNDDIIYVCYDNEAYMNTGVQRSSATPGGAWTTTTPWGKRRPKKNIMEIMAAHRIPYAATASIAFPDDFISKLRKAARMQGTRFFHVLATCPTGWRIPSDQAVKMARLAVYTNVFPLYEIENGESYRITAKSRNLPAKEYVEPQGRFKTMTEDQIMELQAEIDHSWERLQKLAGAEEVIKGPS